MKITPYLLCEYTAAGKTGADIQSKVEEIEALNHTMRDRVFTSV